MQYILIEIDSVGPAYQEVSNGAVQRYTDLDGVTLFASVPSGLGSKVIDANPPAPAWALPDQIIEQPIYVAPARRVSKLEYMNRFHDDELAGIYTAAKSVVQVEIFLAKFNATSVEADGTSIDLDDPRTVAGVQALEYFQLIGEGRAVEILG